MTDGTSRRQRGVRFAMMATAGLLVAIVGVLLASRYRKTPDEEERLPGRRRPIVVHNWPLPRDYRFDPSSFTPPNPNRTFVKTKSGVRAWVIPDASDPVVRLTAALP